VIAEVTNNLVTKIKSVAAFGGRVAATLGGTEADPTLVNIATPSAWVLFQSSQNSDKPAQKWQVMRLNFSVVLFLQYGEGETDFVDTQLKLIDDVSQAVRGKTSSDSQQAIWEVNGFELVNVEPNRMTYQMSFSTEVAYK